MDPRTELMLNMTRRQLLGRGLQGVGGISLASLLGRAAVAKPFAEPQRQGVVGASQIVKCPPQSHQTPTEKQGEAGDTRRLQPGAARDRRRQQPG